MPFSAHSAKSSFKEKLKKGELVVGTWVNAVKDPIIAKLVGYAGFDYILIDAEHSGASISSVSEMCLLARECGVYPMVRPSDPDDLKMNGRLLDAGAMGLVIPHIDSASQALKIARSMRFFGGGTRGCVSRSIGTGFSKANEEEMRSFDEEVTCVVQFESVKAIEEADEILVIDGIDIAIVGRGDLAHDMGLSGKASDEKVSNMVEKVYESARRQNKTQGLLVNDIEEAKKWLARGIKFLTYGSEVGWLISAYEKGLKEIRSAKIN